MKRDNIYDNRINGFYKATKTNAAWSEGKQYYFRDGHTVDDDGDTRPCGEPLEYWTSRTRDWMKKEGLVPATDEMDIFNRVNEAAVNCVDDQVECVEECPYRRTPNCKDQMISDFKALLKMRENRKEQEYKAMPIQGRFRDKKTLEVYTMTDVNIVQTSINRSMYGIRVDFESIDKKFKMRANFACMDEFYEQFEAWDGDKDGGSFNFVALEDLSSESFTRVFRKGHLYSVVEGRVCNCDCDMRFKSFSEMAAYFGGNKLICTVGQGRLDDPTEGLYTGMAVFRRERVSGNRDGRQFTKGKIYRFVNGVARDDAGKTIFWNPFAFEDYFAPIKNLEVGEI